MFTANAIATIALPFATMEFKGATTAMPFTKLPDFSVNLAKAYCGQSSRYHLRLILNSDIELSMLDIDSAKEAMMEAFEELIQQPAVVRLYGRLTLAKATRAQVRIRLGIMVFGERAITRRLTKPKPDMHQSWR